MVKAAASAVYPGSVASASDIGVADNDRSFVVTADADANDSTIEVDDASGAEVGMYLQAALQSGLLLLQVTNVDTTNDVLTVNRAVDGTGDADIPKDQTLRVVVPALMVNQLREEVQAVQSEVGATGSQNFLRADGSVDVTDFLRFTPAASPSHEEGRVFYQKDVKALSVYVDDADVEHNLGQEQWTRVRNDTGSTIPNGSVVYITGFHGGSGLPTIAEAQANSLSASDVLGVVTHDIEANSNGYVTTAGVVRSVDTSAFSAGDKVWLSASTAGGLTASEPSDPNFSRVVGFVQRASASEGQILVSQREVIQGGDGIKKASGALDIEPADFAGQGLEDDGSDDLRIAAAAAGDGLAGGGGSALTVAVADFAGTGLESDGGTPADLRIAAAAAGDGLKGGSGSALAVEPADFAGTGLRDSGADDLEIDLGSTLTFEAGVDWDFGNGVLKAASPSTSDEVATKQYVDATEQGLDWKDSVRAATQSNIDLTSATDPNPIDGVTLSDGDRVLLKAQSTASENGVYVANTATDPSTWTRASDADEDSEVNAGLTTWIEEGTNDGDVAYVLTTDDPITVGTDALSFTAFSTSALAAGDGLTKSGNTINAVGGDGITANANDLAVAVADFAGTGLESDGGSPPDLRIAATAAGDGLKGGGGSALAIEPADFAGTGLQDDGSDNLQIDESGFAPTWGSKHTYQATVQLEDDQQLQLGTTPDYWIVHNATAGELRLRATSVDGAGADGTVFSVTDGGDEVVFQGAVGFHGTNPPDSPPDYTTSNDQTDRTFDADSTTTDELADVLATVINDLIAQGVFQ